MQKTFLWIEDRVGKASYTFWKSLMEEICPDVEVVSKKNNSELVKAVKNLKDDGNKYIIVFDNSFDNLQVLMERKRLKKYVQNGNNIILMDIICFEYILLEFSNLIAWIYAPNDELLTKREKAVLARKKLISTIQNGMINYKDIKEIVEYDENITEHNIEQLTARLLFDLTRNTGFEVSKGRIGECWVKDCCDWQERQEDDICGLDYRRLSKNDKMKSIYEGTCLKEQFSIAEMEIAL